MYLPLSLSLLPSLSRPILTVPGLAVLIIPVEVQAEGEREREGGREGERDTCVYTCITDNTCQVYANVYTHMYLSLSPSLLPSLSRPLLTVPGLAVLITSLKVQTEGEKEREGGRERERDTCEYLAALIIRVKYMRICIHTYISLSVYTHTSHISLSPPLLPSLSHPLSVALCRASLPPILRPSRVIWGGYD